MVLLLGIAIFLMTALSSRRVVWSLSESLIQQASRRTEVKLRGFFQPVERQTRGLRSWGVSGMLDIDDPDRLRPLLQSLLGEDSFNSAVFVADERGREYLLRDERDHWRSRQLRRDEWGDTARWREWSKEDGAPVESEELVEYDPRERPWFKGALAKLERAEAEAGSDSPLHWTEPYIFFSTQEPGITAAAAFRSADGYLQVVGVDVSLTEISRFTSAIRLLDDGAVFVLTEDGRLIGLPRPRKGSEVDPTDEQLLLQRPGDIDSPVAQDASERLLADASQWDHATRIVSEGEPWWGHVSPFKLSADRRILIGVIIPEEDLLGDIHQLRLGVAVISLLVLLVAMWRAAAMARGYSRPVEELVEESKRISTGDLEPGPRIRTRVAEVQHLAEAHNEMRAGLKTLLKLERDLQLARRIQAATFPTRLPELEGFDLAAWNEPADETGGDTFDVVGLREVSGSGSFEITDEKADRAVLLLADATGHGIGPALSVTQLRAMLRMAVRMSPDLGGIVPQINDQLKADLPTGRFITAWLGHLRVEDHTLTTFSAGQAPLVRYRAASNRFEVLESDAMPFGLVAGMQIEVPEPFVMEPGDLYAAISDGIFEAADPADEEFGVERVIEVIRENLEASAEEILEAIRQATESFTHGAPAEDDRTIILIKRI
jgi:serine phosphatase RsbU (regulator of sigma subunit)